MEKLWRLKDIAEQIDVDYQTLWRWSQGGRLQTVRLPGGALRVKNSELERILQEREAV